MVRTFSRWLLLTGVCLTGSLVWSPVMADDALLEPAKPVANDAAENGADNASAGSSAPAELKAVVDAATSNTKSKDNNQLGATPEGQTSVADGTIKVQSPAASDVETIRERFPDGKTKIEREVVRDADDNYVNHGSWKMWDPQGKVVAEGRYLNGRRQGTWTGWFLPSEVEMFTESPFREFTGPFVSQAEFDNGKLNGVWVIYDSKHRKISEWGYAEGRRNGTWTTWYPGGRKMREVHYLNGELANQAREWSPEGALTVDDVYQGGRKLSRKIEYYPGNQKKTDGMFLFAKQELQGEDDWWTGKLAKFTTLGRDERHGEWSSWYSNGQLQMRGRYEHDAPVGEFSWWYSTGQKSVQGSYLNGQKHGQWTWYHENGQKSTHGDFVSGGPNGRWIWWNDNGKVSQKVEYAPGKGEPKKIVSDHGASPDISLEKEDAPSADSDAATRSSDSQEDLVPQAASTPESGLKR